MMEWIENCRFWRYRQFRRWQPAIEANACREEKRWRSAIFCWASRKMHKLAHTDITARRKTTKRVGMWTSCYSIAFLSSTTNTQRNRQAKPSKKKKRSAEIQCSQMWMKCKGGAQCLLLFPLILRRDHEDVTEETAKKKGKKNIRSCGQNMRKWIFIIFFCVAHNDFCVQLMELVGAATWIYLSVAKTFEWAHRTLTGY